MENISNEIENIYLDSKISNEEMLLRSTHSFIAEYQYDTETLKFTYGQDRYAAIQQPNIVKPDIDKILSYVFRPDIPAFKKAIDFSNITKSVERNVSIRLHTVSQLYEWFHIAIYLLVDENGKKQKCVLIFTNTEAESEASNELKLMLKLDYLTQLPNIDTFSYYTRNLIENNRNMKFVIIRLNIMQFRILNKMYGSKEGDNVLRYVGVKIQECMDAEENGTYCRGVSDTFVICMENNKKKVNSVIDYIKKETAKYPNNFEIKISFGIYKITDEDITDNVSVVTFIDRAAYAQKIKNNYITRVAYYDQKIAELEISEQNIIMEMNKALEEKQYKLFLQPKVDMTTGEIVGSEALVRWRHPDKGLVSPADFVPVFEKNGFITEVDYYILKETCKVIRKWINQGIPVKPISVNLSRINIYSPKIFKKIMQCVEEYQIPHNYIEFEITESAFVVDNIYLVGIIEELQKNNFKVLMDDFGSGYSSLNYLRELKVDIIKIDIKFLPVSENDKRANIILKSIVDMSRELGLEIVVEGVETKTQKDLLIDMGCKVAQGYYYYKPMAVEDYEKEVRIK